MCWVDVKTQLPEEGGIVDCWLSGPAAPGGYRRTDMEFVRGSFVRELGDYGCQVTHWRYPPAPPSSGKKSESACKEK